MLFDSEKNITENAQENDTQVNWENIMKLETTLDWNLADNFSKNQ